MPVYPEPPWVLRGQALQSLTLVPVDALRPLLPPGVEPVCVVPGRTLGGLWLGRYGRGSSLEYDELIVMAGLARAGRGTGAWVSRILVDLAESMQGGRAIWGLPKELGHFRSTADGAEVEREGALECQIRFRALPAAAPLPLWVPAVSLRSGRPVMFSGTGRSMARLGWGEWTLPPDSPYLALGLAGRHLTLRHGCLRLVVHAPRRAD